jgi:hypothetical protein
MAQNQTSGVFAFFVYLPDSKSKECIQNNNKYSCHNKATTRNTQPAHWRDIISKQ